MKVKTLIQKLYRAEIDHNIEKVKKIWFKLIKKSLKKKKTHLVQ
jgi:hypothetical protein